MKKGLVKVDWDTVEKYSEEEITYFLYLEGKSQEAICRIRNIDRLTFQKHLIEGKIKYRFLAKANSTEEFFRIITSAGKQDKLMVLNSLSKEYKTSLALYIRDNYIEMSPKDKETAVWILGELKESVFGDILIKASIHKSVSIRRMAVSAMGKIGDIKCETALLRALDDENSQVVLYAIKALTKLKSVKAKDKINTILQSTEKDYLKNAAKEYLDDDNNK